MISSWLRYCTIIIIIRYVVRLILVFLAFWKFILCAFYQKLYVAKDWYFEFNNKLHWSFISLCQTGWKIATFNLQGNSSLVKICAALFGIFTSTFSLFLLLPFISIFTFHAAGTKTSFVSDATTKTPHLSNTVGKRWEEGSQRMWDERMLDKEKKISICKDRSSPGEWVTDIYTIL